MDKGEAIQSPDEPPHTHTQTHTHTHIHTQTYTLIQTHTRTQATHQMTNNDDQYLYLRVHRIVYIFTFLS